MKITDKIVEQIYAGWLGKAIGIRYGAPVEMWTGEQIDEKYSVFRAHAVPAPPIKAMPIRRIIEPPLPDLRGGDVFQIGTVEKAAIEENGTIAGRPDFQRHLGPRVAGRALRSGGFSGEGVTRFPRREWRLRRSVRGGVHSVRLYGKLHRRNFVLGAFDDSLRLRLCENGERYYPFSREEITQKE